MSLAGNRVGRWVACLNWAAYVVMNAGIETRVATCVIPTQPVASAYRAYLVFVSLGSKRRSNVLSLRNKPMSRIQRTVTRAEDYRANSFK